jgi:branched-subunit amino acid aminotransferase/4-amino-4-deoxychorismate lyase
MKAYRTAKDRIVVFRPDENAARIATGANRMCLEEVPKVRASSAPRPFTRSSSKESLSIPTLLCQLPVSVRCRFTHTEHTRGTHVPTHNR